MIGVINYKAGNATSVINALRKLNIASLSITTPKELDNVTGIILPGVGTAQATMDSLTELNLIDALETKVFSDKVPFFGICVGFQVLFAQSKEGNAKCLGWVEGDVSKFPDSVRVPQMGWNKVNFVYNHPLINGLQERDYFYFVNSYYVTPADDQIVLARTDYGLSFCSMIAKDNIFASQFHIEKSGEAGLKLLNNFATMARGNN